MHWTAKGSLFKTTGSSNRMDVVYNDSTKQYVMSVNRVILKWDSCYAKSFQIQVSADATTWTDVFSTKAGGKRSVTDETFTKTSARYVRMLGTERGLTNQGYGLFDFMVLNDTGATVALAHPASHLNSSQAKLTIENRLLHYAIPTDQFIRLEVVDSRGKRVAKLAALRIRL